jgi:hypothetical protein
LLHFPPWNISKQNQYVSPNHYADTASSPFSRVTCCLYNRPWAGNIWWAGHFGTPGDQVSPEAAVGDALATSSNCSVDRNRAQSKR